MYREEGGNREKVNRRRRNREPLVKCGYQGYMYPCSGHTENSHSPGGLADQYHLGGHSLLPLPGEGKEEVDGQPVTLREGQDSKCEVVRWCPKKTTMP